VDFSFRIPASPVPSTACSDLSYSFQEKIFSSHNKLSEPLRDSRHLLFKSARLSPFSTFDYLQNRWSDFFPLTILLQILFPIFKSRSLSQLPDAPGGRVSPLPGPLILFALALLWFSPSRLFFRARCRFFTTIFSPRFSPVRPRLCRTPPPRRDCRHRTSSPPSRLLSSLSPSWTETYVREADFFD